MDIKVKASAHGRGDDLGDLALEITVDYDEAVANLHVHKEWTRKLNLFATAASGTDVLWRRTDSGVLENFLHALAKPRHHLTPVQAAEEKFSKVFYHIRLGASGPAEVVSWSDMTQFSLKPLHEVDVNGYYGGDGDERIGSLRPMPVSDASFANAGFTAYSVSIDGDSFVVVSRDYNWTVYDCEYESFADRLTQCTVTDGENVWYVDLLGDGSTESTGAVDNAEDADKPLFTISAIDIDSTGMFDLDEEYDEFCRQRNDFYVPPRAQKTLPLRGVKRPRHVKPSADERREFAWKLIGENCTGPVFMVEDGVAYSPFNKQPLEAK